MRWLTMAAAATAAAATAAALPVLASLRL